MTLKFEIEKLMGEGASAEDVIRAVLEVEQDKLWSAAEALRADYITEFEYAKETLPWSQQPGYAFKIERRKAGVSLKWARIEFFGGAGKRRRLDRTIARGKSLRYQLSSFPKAHPWEKTLIRLIEEKAAPLRERSDQLARIAVAALALRCGNAGVLRPGNETGDCACSGSQG